MENIPQKESYDGVTVPVASTDIHSADEYNDRRVELQGIVTDSSQSLNPADTGQLSKALFANGVAAQSMIDSGTVNTVVLTPITGASGLRVATPITKSYALLDGAIFNFAAKVTNTGNMTVNVGQNGTALIGSQFLYMSDGSTNIPAGKVIAGRYYSVRYDLSGTKFVLIDNNIYVPEVYTGQESITFPNGLILKIGIIANSANPTTVSFATAFSTIISVSVTRQNAIQVDQDVVVNNVTASSFDIIRGTSFVANYYWQAWGY